MGSQSAKARPSSENYVAGEPRDELFPLETLSANELAELQGVRPVTDLDALGALWPANDDPDAFDEFIAEQRAARRASSKRRP